MKLRNTAIALGIGAAMELIVVMTRKEVCFNRNENRCFLSCSNNQV